MTSLTARDVVILPSGDYEVIGDPEDYSHGPFSASLSLAARKTVQVKRYAAGSVDSHGNVAEAYSEPEELAVFGWAPAGSTEPKLAGQDRVIVDVELFVPNVTVVNLRKVSG